jgi:hypothetical protein
VDEDCNQIAQACDESRMAAGTPVAMILINALRSLSQEELVTLGNAIADRCDHTLRRRTVSGTTKHENDIHNKT